MPKTTMILKLHDGVKRDGTARAMTPNKVVFTQLVDGSDIFQTKIIDALYLDKRDVGSLGFSRETPRFRVTFEPVSEDTDK